MTTLVAEPSLEVGLTETPYLIEAHVHLPAHADVRVAYAVLDAWGWAIHAKRRGQIVTLRRFDGHARAVRGRVVAELRWQAAGYSRAYE
jgi:hypothetical protein